MGHPVENVESFGLGRPLGNKDRSGFFHRLGPLLPGSPLQAQEEAGAGILGAPETRSDPFLGQDSPGLPHRPLEGPRPQPALTHHAVQRHHLLTLVDVHGVHQELKQT